MIPCCIPTLGGRELAYLQECVENNWLAAAGPHIGRLEEFIAARVGVGFAVALSSGTAALQLALLASGIRADDEVILPALSFAASANAVRHCGAWPTFVDIEPSSMGIDPERLEAFLVDGCSLKSGVLVNRNTGRRVAAVMPVHLYGHPVDYEAIESVARAFDLKMIEDGAEALGAEYKGREVGGLGQVCCISFNGNKVTTAGGGGMVLVKDESIAQRIRYLASQARDDPLHFIHAEVGFNHRMPNVNAAIGLAQVEMLDEFLAMKRQIRARYTELLEPVPGCVILQDAPWAKSNCWLSLLEVAPEILDGLIDHLLESGVGVRPTWSPLNHQEAYRGSFSQPSPAAEAFSRSTLCLPSTCSLSEAEIQQVVDAVKSFPGLGPARSPG